MLCQICKERSATIHLTEISDGQRTETHLCQHCAQKEGLAIQAQIPLNELLSTLIAAGTKNAAESEKSEFEHSDKACPVCGMTLGRFSKESLLGCEQDYTEFAEQLTPLIERNQNGASRHYGKVPSRLGKDKKDKAELARLTRDLEKAVRGEDYETAAQLRDRIQKLQ